LAFPGLNTFPLFNGSFHFGTLCRKNPLQTDWHVSCSRFNRQGGKARELTAESFGGNWSFIHHGAANLLILLKLKRGPNDIPFEIRNVAYTVARSLFRHADQLGSYE
jgi:hypothetical protein